MNSIDHKTKKIMYKYFGDTKTIGITLIKLSVITLLMSIVFAYFPTTIVQDGDSSNYVPDLDISYGACIVTAIFSSLALIMGCILQMDWD